MKHEDILRKMFANVSDWLKFAEAKNLGLLTLNAAVVFGLKDVHFQHECVLWELGHYIFDVLAILSFFVALISLFPILSQIEKGTFLKGGISKLSNIIDEEKKFENIHFYGYLKDLDETEFEQEYLAKTDSKDRFSKYEIELTTQILYNSRITWLKYQLFKIGAFFFLSGAVIFGIALSLSAILCVN